jgi:hypothetical protein
MPGILDEFYFQDIDWLFERLGLTWDDYSAVDELGDKKSLSTRGRSEAVTSF